MTENELQELFDKHDDEYQKFDRIEHKRSNRPDLHAMLLVDELCPDHDMIVVRARDSYNEFGLNVDAESLAAVITEEQVIELMRCGVMYDPTNGYLNMFF